MQQDYKIFFTDEQGSKRNVTVKSKSLEGAKQLVRTQFGDVQITSHRIEPTRVPGELRNGISPK